MFAFSTNPLPLLSLTFFNIQETDIVRFFFMDVLLEE